MALLPPAQGTSPVYGLPDDILKMIIDWATEGSEPEWVGWDYASRARNDHALLSLGQVCRSWREVVLQSWERIEVYDRVEWLAFVLPRPHRQLLHVRFHRVGAALKAVPLLQRHAGSLRRLSCCWTKDDYGKRWRGVNKEICRMKLPALEVLCVDNAEVCPPATGAPQTLCPSASRLPALHTLRLSMAYLSWTSNMFEQLRVLHLEEIAPPPLLSLDEFLAVLGRCTRLEELTLAYAFPVNFPDRQDPDSTRAPGSSRIVALPSLRTVNIVWGRSEGPWRDRLEIHQFMRHMRLSPRASVSIDIEHWGFPEEHALWAVVRVDAERLPILRTATAICLTSASREKTVLTASNDEGGSLQVTVTYRRQERSWTYKAEDQLQDFCLIFAENRAPVNRLSIDGDEARNLIVVRGFRSTLATIEATCGDLDLLDHLLSCLGSSAGEDDGYVPAPNLRRLHLRSLPWHTK